jgi:hypothetical protein
VGAESLAGYLIKIGALKSPSWGDSAAGRGSGRLKCSRGAEPFCDHPETHIAMQLPLVSSTCIAGNERHPLNDGVETCTC